ncbi:MAG: hypothetical protein ABEL76_05790, partial [Bradymonadaceae bacterium]
MPRLRLPRIDRLVPLLALAGATAILVGGAAPVRAQDAGTTDASADASTRPTGTADATSSNSIGSEDARSQGLVERQSGQIPEQCEQSLPASHDPEVDHLVL